MLLLRKDFCFLGTPGNCRGWWPLLSIFPAVLCVMRDRPPCLQWPQPTHLSAQSRPGSGNDNVDHSLTTEKSSSHNCQVRSKSRISPVFKKKALHQALSWGNLKASLVQLTNGGHPEQAVEQWGRYKSKDGQVSHPWEGLPDNSMFFSACSRANSSPLCRCSKGAIEDLNTQLQKPGLSLVPRDTSPSRHEWAFHPPGRDKVTPSAKHPPNLPYFWRLPSSPLKAWVYPNMMADSTGIH